MKINEEADKLIQKTIEKHPNTKITIGILHKGKTTFKLFDASGEIPYESYLYEMGSIGKTFTTSLLAKYVQSGQMSLEDSVAKYIPELEKDKYYPTLKRLATHTAGYPERYPIDTWREVFRMNWLAVKGKQIEWADYLTMDEQKMLQLAKEHKLKNKDYKSLPHGNFKKLHDYLIDRI